MTTRLLVEVGNYNYFGATQAQFDAWVKRHSYQLHGPSGSYPGVTLWTASGKPMLRVQELQPLSTTTPDDNW